MKAKLSIMAGILVGAGLFYLAFRNIDLGATLEICRGANSLYLIPYLLTLLAELFFRGVKWKLLLDPARPVRAWDAFRLEAAGLALNNILPLRLGEIVRGTSGAKLFDIPVMTVFATILVERALDTIVLLMLAFAAATLGGLTGGFLDRWVYLWPLIAALAAAVFGLVFVDEIISHHFFSGIFERFPRIKKALSHLALGVRAFHSFRGAAALFAVTAAQWLLDALNFIWLAKAFAIGHVIGAAKGVILIFTAAVACSVPGMPGYFGNLEATLARVVSAWGVPAETSLAYAAYGHIVSYVIVTAIGLVFAYQMGHSLSRIWAQFGGEKK